MKREDLELLVYINKSSYRVNAIKSIGMNLKTPMEITKDIGVLKNHISLTLGGLADKGLVVCVNPEFRKGRLYKLTDKALELYDYVEYTPRYSEVYKKYGDKAVD